MLYRPVQVCYAHGLVRMVHKPALNCEKVCLFIISSLLTIVKTSTSIWCLVVKTK